MGLSVMDICWGLQGQIEHWQHTDFRIEVADRLLGSGSTLFMPDHVERQISGQLVRMGIFVLQAILRIKLSPCNVRIKVQPCTGDQIIKNIRSALECTLNVHELMSRVTMEGMEDGDCTLVEPPSDF
jgi:hypothetical protein